MIKHQTKDDIARGFIELLLISDLDKISVKSICAKVGIARQSFYYHFEDIGDLIAYCVDFSTQDISKVMMESLSIDEALAYLSKVIKKNYDIFRKIFYSPYRVRNQDKMITAIKDWLAHLLRQGMIKPELKIEELEAWLNYHALAILGSCLDLANRNENERVIIRVIKRILTQ